MSDDYGTDLPHRVGCEDCDRIRAARYLAALRRAVSK